MRLLLSLDLSTSCTGFAVFDLDSKKLLRSGRLKPKVPGIHKLKYPKAALLTIVDMTLQVGNLVADVKPQHLVIEEVNRGINRIGQKSLDAVHFFVLHHLLKTFPDLLDNMTYVDSNGKKGWRKLLGLQLSDKDKQVNAEIRLYNRRVKKSQKAPLIDYKVLAQRWVNATFKTTFNVWETVGDNDEVDAIALGAAYLGYGNAKL